MKPTKSFLVITIAVALLASSAASQASEGPPIAPVRPVTDTYFGTPVVDNYRHMENLGDPEVQSWMRAQSTHTRKVLDSIPGRAGLAAKIATLIGGDLRRTDFTRRGDRLFYRLMEPGS